MDVWEGLRGQEKSLVDGWMGGWMGGREGAKSRFDDCSQQSKVSDVMCPEVGFCKLKSWAQDHLCSTLNFYDSKKVAKSSG